MSTPTLAVRTVAVGLLLGVLGMFLTFQRQIGLGFTVFGLIMLGSLIIYARLHPVPFKAHNLIVLVPTVFFTLMLTIRSSSSLTLMNVVGLVIGLTLLVKFFRSENLLKLGLFEYPSTVISTAIDTVKQPFYEVTKSIRWVWAYREDLPYVIPVLRGAAISVPVVAVFVFLLSAADEVFSRLVSDVLHLFTLQNAGNLTQRFVYSGAYAWVAIGVLAVALLERKVKRSPQPTETEPESADGDSTPGVKPALRLGFTEAAMLLGSTCALFTTFVLIQFVYLFGGQRNIADYSYADYIHRGFMELIVVGVLTLGMALALNANTVRRTMAQANVIRGLSTILILLTGVILVSAFERLHLYELTYGFTALRLEIYVFIAWLGFTFAGFILSMYWMPLRVNVFSLIALIAAFGFAATLDVLNPDDFVAWQSIQRGDIDPLYLGQLSEEAVPALVTLIDSPEPGVRSIVRGRLSIIYSQLMQQGNDGLDFNLDRSSALAALNNVHGSLNDATSPFLSHTLEDFSALRSGMTVRAVIRQFGLDPGFEVNATLYGQYSAQENNLTVIYDLVGDSVLDLRFDSATGLSELTMCKKGQCTPIVLTPPEQF